MPQAHSQTRFCENENANSATAVSTVLSAVTPPVPRRRIRRAESRLDRMVPAEVSTVTKLAAESGSESSV